MFAFYGKNLVKQSKNMFSSSFRSFFNYRRLIVMMEQISRAQENTTQTLFNIASETQNLNEHT